MHNKTHQMTIKVCEAERLVTQKVVYKIPTRCGVSYEMRLEYASIQPMKESSI